jgi:hypothetical protein
MYIFEVSRPGGRDIPQEICGYREEDLWLQRRSTEIADERCTRPQTHFMRYPHFNTVTTLNKRSERLEFASAMLTVL